MSLFGICVAFPTQNALADEYCHGKKCGNGIVAFLNSPAGVLIPCRQDQCPIQDSLMEDVPFTIDGEKIVLRKLKAPEASA